MIRKLAALIALGTLLAGCEPGGMMGGMGGGMGSGGSGMAGGAAGMSSNVSTTPMGSSMAGTGNMGMNDM